MTSTLNTTTLTNNITSAFENHLAKMPDNSIIRAKRVLAMEHFLKLGIPDKKNEEYKYSNPGAFLNDSFKLTNNTEVSIPFIALRYIRRNRN